MLLVEVRSFWKSKVSWRYVEKQPAAQQEVISKQGMMQPGSAFSSKNGSASARAPHLFGESFDLCTVQVPSLTGWQGKYLLPID